ncbi:type IV secretion system protein VirB3 [Methylobacterium radiotolerans]|uniref:Type IV secretory pathway VirB3 family protein n=1 Tax=Methylobacterium radiotolerans (strain ATCC 27329 / DSM 1819 / JCM 2831 / NBRC 15690 / NCIMB 10815 / 0-1) TaxID=426355 RepID=B1M9S1_METRJ|nr:VirB3 family type IV secretion system protein [Methylobacterium radiotolerans]ACB28246.1 type IV secretory pathway VirB3 family protein [Methylobacterium radiotolerans JCM 2831]GEN01431.1 type IV secretion protein B [Methylobacterium radiotolerans]
MATGSDSTGSRRATYTKDPLFKGCTRPAMIMGVPVVPFVIVGGGLMLVTIWTSIFCIVLVPVAIMVMRHITKSDDQQFRLLGLKIFFRLINYNRNGSFWQSSAWSPVAFKKRK